MQMRSILLAGALVASSTGAQAQTIGGAQGGLSGFVGNLAGGLLPNVATSSVGNLTGVLGYCLKNRLLGATGARGVLNGLTGRSEVTSSPDFALGQSGLLQTGSGALPLGNLKDTIRTKVCDLVLKQATKLL